MANFKYKVRDKFAKLVSGVTTAENKDSAAKNLKDMGYTPVSIEEAHELGADRILQRFQRVSPEELNTFTRQLYALQKAGLPLLSGLLAISEQTKSKFFKAVIIEISHDVRGGSSFSEALEKHNRIFGDVYTSMIRAAETSGSMDEILERLSLLIEQEIDTKNRIKSATQYPIMAFSTLCLGFVIVVTFVIPRFAAIYSKFDAALPLPTRILIGINIIITKFWYIFILISAALIFGFISFIRSKKGRAIWDSLKLKVPVFGPLISMLIMSRFSRVTAILLRSGVPILEVLELVSRTAGNVIISRAINNIKSSVRQGKGMSEPMKVSGLFPPVVIQMISVGEQTGKVDELLLSAADYYDRESGYIIKNLTSYIEPMLILILAIMVLVMALAIFLPMWNLIKVFKSS